MTQPTLFDTDTIPARRSDPITSQVSAIETQQRLGKLQSRLMEAISEVNARAIDPTANEAGSNAAGRHGGLAESYRKRATELVRSGLLVVTGERHCTVTGKLAQTYRTNQ